MVTPSMRGIIRSTIITSKPPAPAALSPASPSGALTQSWPFSERPVTMARVASRSSSTISSRIRPGPPSGV
jgi:hypothetical protein